MAKNLEQNILKTKREREVLNSQKSGILVNTIINYCGCGNVLSSSLETHFSLGTQANRNKTQECKDHCRHTYRIDSEKYCKVCNESC